jgi:type I restriction enzyme M protein
MLETKIKQENYLQEGINKKIISLTTEGEKEKITYHAKEPKTYNFKDPEEKVRASYFCELVLRYGYDAKDISLDVIMPA